MSYHHIYRNKLEEIKKKISLHHEYTVMEESPWMHFNHSGVDFPEFGFKVHVSLSLEGFEKFSGEVVNEAINMGMSFKLPCNHMELVNLSSGMYGETQVGKLFTIYSLHADKSLEIIECLRKKVFDHKAPKILSDYYYSDGDCISIRYGEIAPKHPQFDLCGRSRFEKQGASGIWVDSRDGTIPSDIEMPSLCGIMPKLAQIKEDLTPEILDYPFKIKRSYGRPLKKIFLIERPSGQHYIVKQVYRYAGESEKGQNFEAQLAHEWNILRRIDGKNIGPRAHQFFLTKNFAYLVMEDVIGDSCEKLPPSILQPHLMKLIAKIEDLHAEGIIHRDIKLSNILFLPKTEDFCLIDFELAAEIGQPLRCSGGTANYRHPEALTGNSAREEFDWFSLRSLLFHVSLGSCPSSLPIRCSQMPFHLRLNGLQEAADLLDQKGSFRKPVLSSNTFKVMPCNQNNPYYAQNSLKTKLPEILWNTPEKLKKFTVDLGPTMTAWRNHHLEYRVHHQGINIGAAGILLGLLSLRKSTDQKAALVLAEKTARHLMQAPLYSEAHGLMTGNAGVAMALAAASRFVLERAIFDAIELRLQTSLARQDEPDFFFGISGIIYALLQVSKLTGKTKYLSWCEPLVKKLMESITDFEGIYGWLTTGALGGEVFPTLGMSHGIAGNAAVLYQYGSLVHDSDLIDAATEIMLRLFTYGRSHQGGFLRVDVHPQSLSKGHNQWCHGSAGVLWGLLISGMWREKNLQEMFQWAAQNFLRQPIVGNPTMCHGLGGMLETAMMLQKSSLFVQEAQEKSDSIAASLVDLLDPKTELWCSEDPRKITPDLWVGHLGPASALALWYEGGSWSVLEAERYH